MPKSRSASSASSAGARRPSRRKHYPDLGSSLSRLRANVQPPLFIPIGKVDYRLGSAERQAGDEASRLIRLTSADDEAVVGDCLDCYQCDCAEFLEREQYDCRHIRGLIAAGVLQALIYSDTPVAGGRGASWH